ncbi:MBL fold metallo-hydrolase [Collibacillus ludicampi]|uniref:MBL fold metallo-hydrolase n=1 Tax=Collibacillus ludicampi TaxID=2771369 RepID=A0AAV4LH04_9BACL|nr:MBL fold metallo-hydrolase [Collibacillus ludicampi]GIM47121.1 MBL fold metallo-hydrolase [Collibacillus ludicampi]
MRIRQHGFIYQLTFLPSLFPVNCYLVEEETELTLIDTALPYSHKGILQAAKKIGKPITRIVLTHAHEDHVGSLDHLKNALPKAMVMISKRDAKILEGDRALEPGEPQTPIRGGVPKWVQTRPDYLLNDGDRVGSLKAVFSPGHTPGSMAFIDMRNQALIAGDAFQTRGGIAVAGTVKPLFPFPAFGTWNKELAWESARRLRDLHPSLLAVGHGSMIMDPVEAMSRALKDAEKTLKRRGNYAERS